MVIKLGDNRSQGLEIKKLLLKTCTGNQLIKHQHITDIYWDREKSYEGNSLIILVHDITNQ